MGRQRGALAAFIVVFVVSQPGLPRQADHASYMASSVT